MKSLQMSILNQFTGLSWSCCHIRKPSVQLKFDGAPELPGIYRLTWVGPDWPSLRKAVTVCASPLMGEVIFDFSTRAIPARLSYGTSGTNLSDRLTNNFSNNCKSNRLMKRFRLIAPTGMTDDGIRVMVARNVTVEWVTVPDPFLRNRLEKFGQAWDASILDALHVEH
jgi:hypothetical protein